MAIIKNNDIAQSIYLGSKGKSGNELKLYFEAVVKFLARKRLLSKAPDILSKLKRILNQEAGIIEAKVISTGHLREEARHKSINLLKLRYSAKDVILNEEVDPSLLGGLRIEVGDEIIDASLKNKVKKLQTYLKAS